jgi:cob(I)alamin adenosyltransferase
MKIYTKTGDNGESGLPGGRRKSKDSLIFAVFGTLDELNACLGVCRSEMDSPLNDDLFKIQGELFSIGSMLALEGSGEKLSKEKIIGENNVKEMETLIDRLSSDLPLLTHFIVPGGGRAGAYLHLARSVCRRAERLMVRWERKCGSDSSVSAVGGQHENLIFRYLNRLSDLLFVMARYANKQEGYRDQIRK